MLYKHLDMARCPARYLRIDLIRRQISVSGKRSRFGQGGGREVEESENTLYRALTGINATCRWDTVSLFSLVPRGCRYRWSRTSWRRKLKRSSRGKRGRRRERGEAEQQSSRTLLGFRRPLGRESFDPAEKMMESIIPLKRLNSAILE